MFGIGTWELIVILLLALIILGPDKLPSVARTVGRTLTSLRKTADEVKREIDLDGLKGQIQSELLDDPELEELQRNLDVRSDIRRAMTELEDPPALPGPDPAVSDDGPSDVEPERTIEPGSDPADIDEDDPEAGPGSGLAG